MSKLRNIGLALLLFGATSVFAQAVPDPIQYIVAPETPGPGEQVTIEAQGVGAFLGDATITWRQNGKVVKSGLGETNYSFVAGGLGAATQVTVQISSATHGSFSHSFVFLPSVVNLLWEANTSVPPLYRGKALYSAGSTLKVVAYPTIVVNGAQLSSSALSYQWSRGSTAQQSSSGLGKRSITIQGDQIQTSETIAVDVYYGGSKVGRGEVTIPAIAPQVLFYAQDPLRGLLLDSALPQALSLTAKEITVQAIPYFFANESAKNNSLTYSWTLNGAEAAGPDSQKGILTLRQTGSGAGGAQLGVAIQNNDDDKLVQAANTVVQVLFGQTQSSSSIFGL